MGKADNFSHTGEHYSCSGHQALSEKALQCEWPANVTVTASEAFSRLSSVVKAGMVPVSKDVWIPSQSPETCQTHGRRISCARLKSLYLSFSDSHALIWWVVWIKELKPDPVRDGCTSSCFINRVSICCPHSLSEASVTKRNRVGVSHYPEWFVPLCIWPFSTKVFNTVLPEIRFCSQFVRLETTWEKRKHWWANL